MDKILHHIPVVTLYILCWLISTMAAGEDSTFKVYWNVPTFMCDHRGIHINVTKYGIIQNSDDAFLGDHVDIWYQPGKFPHMDNGVAVDGGIPQRGNLEDHKKTFTAQVEKLPADFDGTAVLDFEAYLPSCALAPKEYKNASKEWTKIQHPDLTPEEIEEESQRSFDAAIKEFMEVLLKLGAEMRPKALWGYYHYPYCQNHKGATQCGTKITNMNNDTLWLYESSTAMYPSVYLSLQESVEERKTMVLVRIQEAKRLNQLISKSIPILTYCWYKEVKKKINSWKRSYFQANIFRYCTVLTSPLDDGLRLSSLDRYYGTGYLTAEDLLNTIGLSKEQGIDGSVIWGSSNDLNTKEKCLEFQKYVEDILGPLIQTLLGVPASAIRQALQSRDLMKEMISIATHQV